MIAVICYTLEAISIVLIGMFAVFFISIILSYLCDKYERSYIKMPASQIISYISLAPKEYEIFDGRILRDSLVLFPNSFIGYIKILLFEHRLEKNKANAFNRKEHERYLKIVLNDVEKLKKQNAEIVQRVCAPPVDPIAAYFDNKNLKN